MTQPTPELPTPGQTPDDEVVIYDDLPDPSVYRSKGKRGTASITVPSSSDRSDVEDLPAEADETDQAS